MMRHQFTKDSPQSRSYTLPKTYIASENRPFPKESRLWTLIFQGICWFYWWYRHWYLMVIIAVSMSSKPQVAHLRVPAKSIQTHPPKEPSEVGALRSQWRVRDPTVQLHGIFQPSPMFGRSVFVSKKYVHFFHTKFEMCAWYHANNLVLDLMTFPVIPCINFFVSVHDMIQVSL